MRTMIDVQQLDSELIKIGADTGIPHRAHSASIWHMFYLVSVHIQ